MSDNNAYGDARRKQRAKAESSSVNNRRKIIGPSLSFAGAEAYKTLRTNLMLSLSADIPCKVIGVTSAMRGEGKSTSSINLAYTLAEANKRVLLVEADMRIPYMAQTLEVAGQPGLSNFLTGQVSINNVVRVGVLQRKLFVIPAGDVPPNPAELISSPMMEQTIESLKRSFDYIVIDLPPIGAVSDGLAISRLLTGMVVVVRENYCDKRALSDTMRQLEYLKVKVLGFVFNSSESRTKAYNKYGYNVNYYQMSPEDKKKIKKQQKPRAKVVPEGENPEKIEPSPATPPAPNVKDSSSSPESPSESDAQGASSSPESQLSFDVQDSSSSPESASTPDDQESSPSPESASDSDVQDPAFSPVTSAAPDGQDLSPSGEEDK